MLKNPKSLTLRCLEMNIIERNASPAAKIFPEKTRVRCLANCEVKRSIRREILIINSGGFS